MESLKPVVSELQNDTVKVMKCLSRLLMSNSNSQSVIEKGIDEYMCELETLCISSRNMLEGFKMNDVVSKTYEAESTAKEISGSIDVTSEGWLHIRLNTLLPSCKYKVSNYIGDTISRLLKSTFELPYFENAFLAVVEYCNLEKHNSLDNDNKAWKMIPNALKGRVIEDDSQFRLSIGLFAKMSEDLHCDIYVLPPEDASFFMDYLEKYGT